MLCGWDWWTRAAGGGLAGVRKSGVDVGESIESYVVWVSCLF